MKGNSHSIYTICILTLTQSVSAVLWISLYTELFVHLHKNQWLNLFMPTLPLLYIFFKDWFTVLCSVTVWQDKKSIKKSITYFHYFLPSHPNCFEKSLFTKFWHTHTHLASLHQSSYSLATAHDGFCATILQGQGHTVRKWRSRERKACKVDWPTQVSSSKFYLLIIFFIS